MRLLLGLGSNLGDRRQTLRLAAIAAVEACGQSGMPFRVGGLYESEPLDCPQDSPRFLNSVLEMDSELEPMRVLAALQAIEQSMGRPAVHGKNTPRTVDLDILVFGDDKMHSEILTLPHPEISRRPFVLAPLADLDPGMQLPGCPNGVAARLGEFPPQDIPRLVERDWLGLDNLCSTR